MRKARANGPGVTFPPPLVYLGFLAIGLALGWLWPVGLGGSGWQIWVGAPLIAIGLVLMTAGVLTFRREGTNIAPNRPARVLVTDGPWRFSRNPLYLSLTLIYLGVAIAADSPWAVILVVPAVLIIRYAVVAREERYLESRFGDDYRRYKASVRRWI
ncbi:MAG TPA: isoprenylcysteine carboxylmethyltransferase family protein [Alphaproteobacteria bacterium]|jgi:protein-S-isoprenylcysteine O-methyltransferase Ste14